jgi:guanosine-3',5'-bis(diphosphate) 3'-pyrophosphohydrolase
MTRIEQAQQMAHEAHESIGQRRKYTGEPYWVHTDEVARIVAEDGGDEDMIVAAHLHDVLEDVTPINPHYDLYLIDHTFGGDVSRLVSELTDEYTKAAFPDMNRASRHKMENRRLANISLPAKTIKLADLISNTHSIVEYDKDFARVYLQEKWELLPLLKDGSPALWQRASDSASAGFIKLMLTPPLNPLQ